MSLKLYYHPLSSYCHKALIALYENTVPFEPVFLNLGDEKASDLLRSLWPITKFPVLRDETRQQTIAEATVIIEYLDAYAPGATRFVPRDVDGAWQARMWDRFFDLYLHEQMQKIVGDCLRPAGENDPFGVKQAKARIEQAYGIIDKEMAGKTWWLGDNYSLVDCAASPSLFYANTAMPFDPSLRNLWGYFERLMMRPSYARVLKEAEPYFNMFPLEPKPVRLTQAA
jgi:glutathione S-transferase